MTIKRRKTPKAGPEPEWLTVANGLADICTNAGEPLSQTQRALIRAALCFRAHATKQPEQPNDH